MGDYMLTGDQAIFTSIRTPTGEGYRIVAASRGLRPDEKQAITRSSPSHDALCPEPDESSDGGDLCGVSFYPLPRGRLCVSVSCLAGEEHTGRGGSRVYTHSVVFDTEAFPQCGFNPFVVVRAMIDAGLARPQLQPEPVLPELALTLPDPHLANGRAQTSGTLALLSRAWREHTLHALLHGKQLVLNLPRGWTDAAETLLMGIPGPMRADISFSAGVRVSVSRCHRLALLHDDSGATRSRLAGRNVLFYDPSTTPDPQTDQSAWVSFVERHWASGQTKLVAQRTSRPYAAVDEAGREWIAQSFNDIDNMAELNTTTILTRVGAHLRQTLPDSPGQSAERLLSEEFCCVARETLLDRVARTPWGEFKKDWVPLCELWRRSDHDCAFADPIVRAALQAAGKRHPCVAAQAALPLTHLALTDDMRTRQTAILDQVLACLEEWAQQPDAAIPEHINDLDGNVGHILARWRNIRPNCPAIERIQQRLTSPVEKT